MNNEILYIPPVSLCILTTYKCTSSCENCCFQCSPNRNEKLTISEIKFYIKETICSFYSVKLLILSGGESFLLMNELEEIVNFASRLGLKVRIVTNAFWASSYKKAFQIVNQLKKVGLSEINYSTGDDHQKFVPINNILNGIIAAVEQNINVVVNVESSDDRNFNSKFLKEHSMLIPYIKIGKLRILNGIWVQFKNKNNKDTEIPGISRFVMPCYGGYSNLFSTIAIDPDHRMLACCGLISKYSKYLDLGNLKTHSIKELYLNQFKDFLKIWIATEGPYEILNYISQFTSEDYKIYKSMHICQVCNKVLNTPRYINILRKEYKKVYSNVMFKYIMKVKETKID
ncbi:radical SAM protein [Phocaeicola oris]|uniref:radical SAM protein n=1 Tax=Phocaeicola oris TaxID=2896850 RepID=UPI00234FB4AA|nr:hypothetical protein [Phocaeicola oris]MCE2615394.1 hypothetical protein [Phocaeicola oris]